MTPDYRTRSGILLVFAGGAVGTLIRQSLDLLTPVEGLPYTTFAINIAGSFALAVLYTALADGRGSSAAQRRLRLLLGTGLMGGFTTYSSFSVGVAAAIDRGSVGDGILYAAGTIVLGPVAALLGRLLTETLRPRRAAPPEAAR